MIACWCAAALMAGDAGAAARAGAEWLLQMQQADGTFLYGWMPARHAPLPGDQPLRQAGAALALARAGRELDDRRFTAAAERAFRTLLARRSALPPDIANPTGFAALLLIGLAEFAPPPPEFRAVRRELSAFLQRQQRADGSFRVGAGRAEDAGDDPPGNIPFYAPQALLGLLRQQTCEPRPELLAAARKGFAWQRRWWEDHPHEAFPPWMIPACAELHAATNDRGAAALAFELAEWCLQLQHGAGAAPEWRGGFGTFQDGRRWATPPGSATASFCEGLGAAAALAAKVGDRSKAERYVAACRAGAMFLQSLQFMPERLEHFVPAARPRLSGGFPASLDDGNLRIDQNQHAVCALLALRMAARGSDTMALRKH